MDDLIDGFSRLSACQVSDGLSEVGLSPQGLEGIRALEPAGYAVGRAMTVVFEPAETGESKRLEYLAHAKPGDVLMLAHSGRVDCSVWGGQRTIGAQQRGAVATVVDGAYRDIDEHRAAGYPVFGRAPTVVSSRGMVTPVAVDEVVTMAGVEVAPGDIVVADASGVVVVPQDRAQEVLRAAEGLADEERRISDAVDSGEDFVRYREAVRSAR